MTNDRRRFYSDLFERVTWTFVQAFIGAVIVDGLGAGLDTFDKVKLAAIAGLVSAGKCLLATQIGSANTAATLPEEQDTPRPDPQAGHADAGGLLYGLLAVVVLLVLLRILHVI